MKSVILLFQVCHYLNSFNIFHSDFFRNYSVSLLLKVRPTPKFLTIPHNITRLSGTIFGKQLGLQGKCFIFVSRACLNLDAHVLRQHSIFLAISENLVCNLYANQLSSIFMIDLHRFGRE